MCWWLIGGGIVALIVGFIVWLRPWVNDTDAEAD